MNRVPKRLLERESFLCEQALYVSLILTFVNVHQCLAEPQEREEPSIQIEQDLKWERGQLIFCG